MTNQLNHHGIKGQKWGVRRYQNEDGSLTSAGRKNISKSAKKADLKDAKKLVRKDNLKKGLKRTGIILGVIGALTVAGIATEANRKGISFAAEGKDFMDSMKFTGKFVKEYATAGRSERQAFRNLGK